MASATAELFETIPCASWEQLMKELPSKTNHGRWIFRGQAARHAGLMTQFDLWYDRWSKLCPKGPKDRRTVEEAMVRDFQRTCSRVVAERPPKEDYLAWLALMRHHGAPTRLLDWTYSPYVAAYVAIRDVIETPRCEKCGQAMVTESRCPSGCKEATPDGDGDGMAAVWAIEYGWFAEKAEGKLPRRLQWVLEDRYRQERDPRAFDELFRGSVHWVYPVNPYALNERLAIQQGLFLCQGDIETTFHDNFAGAMAGVADGERTENLRRFTIGGDLWHALQDLRRMNISEASLFPGLDGFAQQYKYCLPPE